MIIGFQDSKALGKLCLVSVGVGDEETIIIEDIPNNDGVVEIPRSFFLRTGQLYITFKEFNSPLNDAYIDTYTPINERVFWVISNITAQQTPENRPTSKWVTKPAEIEALNLPSKYYTNLDYHITQEYLDEQDEHGYTSWQQERLIQFTLCTWHENISEWSFISTYFWFKLVADPEPEPVRLIKKRVEHRLTFVDEDINKLDQLNLQWVSLGASGASTPVNIPGQTTKVLHIYGESAPFDPNSGEPEPEVVFPEGHGNIFYALKTNNGINGNNPGDGMLSGWLIGINNAGKWGKIRRLMSSPNGVLMVRDSIQYILRVSISNVKYGGSNASMYHMQLQESSDGVNWLNGIINTADGTLITDESRDIYIGYHAQYSPWYLTTAPSVMSYVQPFTAYLRLKMWSAFDDETIRYSSVYKIVYTPKTTGSYASLGGAPTITKTNL